MIKDYLKAPWIWTLLVSILLNVGTWLIAIYIFPQDQIAAILHYNTSVGIDFIGEGQEITSIPLIGSLLLVGNMLLASFLYRASTRASTMFWASLPLIQLTLLVALLLILRLN